MCKPLKHSINLQIKTKPNQTFYRNLFFFSRIWTFVGINNLNIKHNCVNDEKWIAMNYNLFIIFNQQQPNKILKIHFAINSILNFIYTQNWMNGKYTVNACFFLFVSAELFTNVNIGNIRINLWADDAQFLDLWFHRKW